MNPVKARIAEIFESIQGEGLYLGERQIFVRFFGCNLNCQFCDTNQTRFEEYELEELFKAIKQFRGKYHSISFTGGEPLLQVDFLKVLMRLTHNAGFINYLETNGTLPGELKEVIDDVDIIAMDIKLSSSTQMGTLLGLHRKFLEVASQKEVFLKAVICQNTSLEELMEAVKIIKEVNRSAILILQPNSLEDCEALSGKLAGFKEACLKEGVTTCIIPQMHKIAGIK